MKPEPISEPALFHAALELPPAQRAAYLAQACAGDAALHARIQALLAVQSKADALFDSASQATHAGGTAPAAPGGTVRLNSPTEKAGDIIGRYKLLQQIGEGGCGVVYMAEQSTPVKRRVAIKVIKLGMDTKQVVARFEAERQALALMDHPNIAKVLDAGATETGRPFFVMELVRGTKITEFADQQKLSTPERLDLFIQVCSAIQHAHQKGIIHRDIKPSNVLVTMLDGKAIPKVIDFGIAKATSGQELTDKTLFTAFEQFIGTPAYMSPEQAEMSAADIDTRSDIYSLGVLLYELLTGRTPFDATELLRSGVDGIRKTLRDQEPDKPSARLNTLAAVDLTTVAKARHVEPLSLLHSVRGDLDWVVMKCLEKDRARRYETANGIAADLKRHLGNEPVTARPPSTTYRLQKLMRRNKVAFAAGTAIAASLVIGITVSVWQAVLATRAKKEAVTAFDELRATAPAFAEQARGLAAREQYADAITKLDYAIKLRPDAAEYLVQKADLLQCQLRLADAAAIYREALRVQPGHARAEASAKLCDELLAAPLKEDGKLTLESLGKLHLAMQKQQRSAAELMPAARLLGREKEIMLAFWLERLKDLPISADKPLKDRLTVRDDGLLELDLKDAKINDLAPLAGMPLGSLILWNCKDLADFTPLRDFRQLTSLDLDSTQISDLAPLQDLPLEVLYFNDTGVSDLSPLRGMKLKDLEIRYTRVSDLTPLKEMPLIEFSASTIFATDFSALKGAPLESFHLDVSLVQDLSFLADAPVKVLYLNQCHALRGLAFLAKMKSLERLILPRSYRTLPDEELAAIGALKDHPRLQWIQADQVSSRSDTDRWMMSRATQPKKIFWEDWNREQTFLPAIRKTGFEFSITKLSDLTYRLVMKDQPLSDLSFLNKDAPISQLSLPGCKVADLGPIRNLPLRILQLSGNPVTDLAPLTNMPLEILRLEAAPISDLTPLGRLPLKELYLNGCSNITDVAVIAGITTLEKLTVPRQARNVEALKKLTGLKMLAYEADRSRWIPNSTAKAFWETWEKTWESLAWMRKLNDAGVSYTATEIVEGTPQVAAPKGSADSKKNGKQAAAKPVGKPTGFWEVTITSKEFSDCSIFKGAPIWRLNLGNTAVNDLEPLRGMALKQLRLYNTKVADLGPLKGMPLERLAVSGTPVTDLKPLHGMPLTDLKMHRCQKLTDLSPIADCKGLMMLTLPPDAKDIEFLSDRSKFAKLERIGFKEDPKNGNRPDKAYKEFWDEHDAKKRAESKQP